jgi:hypothetical protein
MVRTATYNDLLLAFHNEMPFVRTFPCTIQLFQDQIWSLSPHARTLARTHTHMQVEPRPWDNTAIYI